MPSLREELYLIGFSKHQLTGCKLPSKGDCLKVFFYNLKTTKLSVKDSARLVIKECSVFWEKARIPFQDAHKAANKLIGLYNEWRNLVRSKSRNSQIYNKKREEWKEQLNYLFDIAHVNAMDIIKIEEDRQFLIKQRKKGREGIMVGVDLKLKQKEDRRKNRERKGKAHKLYEELPSTSTGKIYIFFYIPVGNVFQAN